MEAEQVIALAQHGHQILTKPNANVTRKLAEGIHGFIRRRRGTSHTSILAQMMFRCKGLAADSGHATTCRAQPDNEQISLELRQRRWLDLFRQKIFHPLEECFHGIRSHLASGYEHDSQE